MRIIIIIIIIYGTLSFSAVLVCVPLALSSRAMSDHIIFC